MKKPQKMTTEEIEAEMESIERETYAFHDHLMFDPSPFLGEEATASWENNQFNLITGVENPPQVEDNPRYRELLKELSVR